MRLQSWSEPLRRSERLKVAPPARNIASCSQSGLPPLWLTAVPDHHAQLQRSAVAHPSSLAPTPHRRIKCVFFSSGSQQLGRHTFKCDRLLFASGASEATRLKRKHNIWVSYFLISLQACKAVSAFSSSLLRVCVCVGVRVCVCEVRGAISVCKYLMYQSRLEHLHWSVQKSPQENKSWCERNRKRNLSASAWKQIIKKKVWPLVTSQMVLLPLTG